MKSDHDNNKISIPFGFSMDFKIPFLRPPFSDCDIEAAVRVMKTANISKGNEVSEFEKRFARLLGDKYATAVNSGTSALELSLEALTLAGRLDVRDTVALPSFTYVGVANAVVNAGLRPVFVDIDPETMCIGSVPNTDGIIFVHTFGHPVPVELIEHAHDEDMVVLEDCAEACGSYINNHRYVGTFSCMSIFSFNATKNMTTGEGGAVMTNDDSLYKILIALREQGFYNQTLKGLKLKGLKHNSEFVFPGHNMRMSNIVAALGLSQLDKLPDMNARRLELARKYNDLLRDAVTVPDLPDGHSVQLYTIRVPENKREHVINYLKACGVEAKVYFKPIHQFEFYQRYFSIEPLKVTEQVAKEVVSLPMYPSLTDDEVIYVANAINVALK